MSVTECKAAGTLKIDVNDRASRNRIPSCANLLRSLCASYRAISLHEVVLKVPLQLGTTSTRLKMSRRLPVPQGTAVREAPPSRWEVWHESQPWKGPNFADLPASIYEVSTCSAYSNTTPEFWQSLGATYEYELVREGNEYVVVVDGIDVRVLLVSLQTLSEPGNVSRHKLHKVSDNYLVEATCRVPEGKHLEGAAALGTFAKQISEFVALSRPDVG